MTYADTWWHANADADADVDADSNAGELHPVWWPRFGAICVVLNALQWRGIINFVECHDCCHENERH